MTYGEKVGGGVEREEWIKAEHGLVPITPADCESVGAKRAEVWIMEGGSRSSRKLGVCSFGNTSCVLIV